MNDFVMELTRDVGDLEYTIASLRRTRIDRVTITPTPDGVEVGFRARLAPRVDIAIHKVITGNYHQDKAAEGSFAALRFSRPISGNTHFQRIEDGGYFTFEQGTEYWLDLACPDIDHWGKVHGILHHRRRFVTSRRNVQINVVEIVVDGDSDKFGRGEIYFYYRYFDMVRGGFFAEYQTTRMSIASGERVTRPFNPNFYEPVYDNAPKAIGLYYFGEDDDGPNFGPQGLTLDPGRPPQMPDRVHGHFTGYTFDNAFATDRITLRSAPGEDVWMAELATHPEGRLRFRVIASLRCKVEALPQPIHVAEWVVDALRGPKVTHAWNGPPAQAWAQASTARIFDGDRVVDLRLGCDGACVVDVVDDGLLKARWTASDGLAALLPLPASGKGGVTHVHAIDLDGRVRIAERIDTDKRMIGWADTGVTLTDRLPMAIRGRDEWAWLAETDDGAAVLLTSDGNMRRMRIAGGAFPAEIWGCPYEGDWLVWGQFSAGGPWQAMDLTAKVVGSSELPKALGMPFAVLRRPASGPLIYGLDDSRVLWVWDVTQAKLHDLGLFDGVIASAIVEPPPPETAKECRSSA